ncbi:hypothetical protein SAMN04244553_6706 [Nocardia amikacinitolerans]|uniref:Uncharacterized protein n=1 Tax=Nocardia amikacinitolerans TaxID=756689 RepID=A0A285LZW1_9NOCA|nr:hypothetical protein [Nocardia amikacinitolerans]SNY89687.1 hypothetical protein SAMN04244553_6706 [Nocardia amikacinitolerans]
MSSGTTTAAGVLAALEAAASTGLTAFTGPALAVEPAARRSVGATRAAGRPVRTGVALTGGGSATSEWLPTVVVFGHGDPSLGSAEVVQGPIKLNHVPSAGLGLDGARGAKAPQTTIGDPELGPLS